MVEDFQSAYIHHNSTDTASLKDFVHIFLSIANGHDSILVLLDLSAVLDLSHYIIITSFYNIWATKIEIYFSSRFQAIKPDNVLSEHIFGLWFSLWIHIRPFGLYYATS